MSLPDPNDAHIGGFDRLTLTRYLADELIEEERQAVEKALDQDTTLREFLEAERQDRVSLTATEILEKARPTPSRWLWSSGLAAAMAVFLAFVFSKTAEPPVLVRGPIAAEIFVLSGNQQSSEPTMAAVADGATFQLVIRSAQVSEVTLMSGPSKLAAKQLWFGESRPGKPAFTSALIRAPGARYWLVPAPSERSDPDAWQELR